MSADNELLFWQFFWSAIHSLCAGGAYFAHGYYWALPYDRRDLNCAYYKRGEGVAFATVMALMVAIFSSIAVTAVYDSPAPFFVFSIQALGHVMVLLIGDTNRWALQRRLASVRYMQHKYGLDADLLLQLLERHALPHFPVVYFEAALKDLTAEQCDGYSASEKVREQMAQEVQDAFVLRLSVASGEVSSTLAFFRAECDKPRQATKLSKLIRDFYAKAKNESSKVV